MEHDLKYVVDGLWVIEFDGGFGMLVY